MQNNNLPSLAAVRLSLGAVSIVVYIAMLLPYAIAYALVSLLTDYGQAELAMRSLGILTTLSCSLLFLIMHAIKHFPLSLPLNTAAYLVVITANIALFITTYGILFHRGGMVTLGDALPWAIPGLAGPVLITPVVSCIYFAWLLDYLNPNAQLDPKG